MKIDKRIDQYIMSAENFAKPVLNYIRILVHRTCPEAEETMKWNFPHFLYNNEILCSMAAFKKHCAFGFWKGSLIPELNKSYGKEKQTAMGQFGRIESLKDLPPDKLFVTYINKAIALNEAGAKNPLRMKAGKPTEMETPDYFLKAIRKNKNAWKTFESFSISKKNEYILWITEAKTEATRNKRITTALEWMEEGKDRNWKYR